MRPQALALSPDGRLLVTAGKTHDLVVLDPRSGKVLQRVPLPSEKRSRPDAQAGLRAHPPARQGGPAQLHRPGLLSGRLAHLPGERGWQHQSVRRRQGRQGGRLVHHSAAAGQRPGPQGGNPRRPRGVPGRQTALRGAQPLQSPRRAGRRHGQGPAALGRGRRALTTSCWPGTRPTSATGAAGGPTRTASPARPGSGTLVRVDPVRYIASEGLGVGH